MTNVYLFCPNTILTGYYMQVPRTRPNLEKQEQVTPVDLSGLEMKDGARACMHGTASAKKKNSKHAESDFLPCESYFSSLASNDAPWKISRNRGKEEK